MQHQTDLRPKGDERGSAPGGPCFNHPGGRLGFLLIWLALSSVATGQQGDRPGEVQAPPPADLDIPPAPPLTPKEAMETFALAPGLRLDLVAAEPLVRDPVAIAFDPDGRLWVVEMTGFMPNVDGEGEDEPVGSIAVLDDTDGDGRMDERTVFLDGLVLPRAIGFVDGGVLVGEPPHLWFCRDTDGDDRADTKEEIFDDYGRQGNPEHTANGLYRAIDNWIYNARSDMRFRYETGEWLRDETAFRGQWGITQDDTGRLLYNDNSDPVRGDLLPAEWMLRNPNLARPAGVDVSLAPDRSTFPIRVTPGINRGYELLGEDQKLPVVTAACGVVAYRGGIFPDAFANNLIVCEPSGNLVQRYKWREEDGRLTAVNAYAQQESELLASTDERFRPVNSALGPDGGLYLVDMYRGIIQHRIFVTTYLRKQIIDRGLEKPIGMGRIWRIVPEDAELFPRPQLSDATTAQLVAHLAHPNGWWRDTAQRLLVEQRDAAAAVPLLRDLVTTSEHPLARLHALWTLEGLHALDEATLRAAWNDNDVAVRTTAYRLGARLLDGAVRDVLQSTLIDAAGGDHWLDRAHAALALGDIASAEAEAALLEILVRYPDDRLLVDAVVSGLAGRELPFIEQLVAAATTGDVSAPLARLTTCVVRERDRRKLDRLFALVADAATGEAVRGAIITGIENVIAPSHPWSRRRQRKFELEAKPEALITLAAQADDPLASRAQELLGAMDWPGKETATAEVAPLTPEEELLFADGQKTYLSLCAACHLPSGEGISGLSRPLIGSRWTTGPEEAVIRIVLHGKRSEGLPAPMAPLGTLDDRQIAGALTYIRRSWGHEASVVNPEAVAEVRAATAGRVEPWTDEELETLFENQSSD